MSRQTFLAGTVLTLALAGFAATAQVKPAAAPSASAANQYSVDDVHSCALFRVQHFGAGQFWGRINGVSGTFTLADDAAKCAFSVDVAVDSIDTSNEKLDGHLKSPDFFNAAEFPTMTFRSTSAKKTASGMLEVAGAFTLHGVTKPITAMIEVTGQAEDGARGGAEAIFTIKRSEFGMNYGVEKGALGDSVRVVVNLEGVKAKG